MSDALCAARLGLARRALLPGEKKRAPSYLSSCLPRNELALANKRLPAFFAAASEFARDVSTPANQLSPLEINFTRSTN